MALDDRSRARARNKTRNATQRFRGQLEETAGRATNNPEMAARGRGNQFKANLKQAGEKLKDAFRRRR
jgi:uncharacterized protein YjbJ (UPF0337 family)